MAERADVLIVGGGPAGAATALGLARRGVDVVLIERARFPREKLCGDFLHPLGTAALEQLGLLGEVLPRAHALRGMVIVSPQGREVFARFPGGMGLSVSRTVLDDVLLRAAERAGAEVRTGVAAHAITRRGDCWRVGTDGGVVEARLLVGADGLHSRVAVAAGLRARPRRHGRYGIGIYVCGLPGPEGFAEMHLGRGTYCGVSRFADGQTNVTMVVPRAVLGARPTRVRGLGRGTLDELLTAFPRLRSRVRTAVTSREPRAIGPLAPTNGPVVADGILLVGDAAVFTEPLTGQGVSLALTAAPIAARTIAAALGRGDLRAPALAPYARWHRQRAGGLWRFLQLVDWLALRTPFIEPLARAWQDRPALATRFLGVIGGGAPTRTVVNPAYVSGLIQGCIWRA